jgi:uncharacterized protein (TIGR03790 family)
VLLGLLVGTGCLGGPLLQAADSGASVVVVYNQRLPESKAVAEYYARRREVPARQVLGFDLPVTETMTRVEFTEQLQKPLAKALTDGKLWTLLPERRIQRAKSPGEIQTRVAQSKFRYLALCYGVPTRVLMDSNLVERGTEQTSAELRRNGAAVDSELAWLPQPEPVKLAGPLPNPFYSATNGSMMHPTNGLLLVSRLDGPTPAIARGLVDKALEAETDGLWGRAYFDTRGITNGEYVLGDNWLRAAAEIARRMGFETVTDDKPETFSAGFPMSQIAFYAGWYDGTVSGPFSRPTVEFMPGAFAYHLHSFSAGTVRSANQNWVGPLLAKGATVTMGAVDEPYLAGTPDIAIFLARFIHLGFSFGEAAWASQNSLSWQNLAVGDPLYQPFARRPDRLQADLEKRASPLLAWSHLRWVNWNMAPGAPPEEGIAYLESQPITRQSAVLTEKLADLFWAKKQLTDALDTYEQALKLNPSPQQKLRLLLMLGQRRAITGPELSALNHYQQVLREFPEYPDTLKVCQQLLPLAQKLDKKDVVEKCEQEIKRLTPPVPATK